MTGSLDSKWLLGILLLMPVWVILSSGCGIQAFKNYQPIVPEADMDPRGFANKISDSSEQTDPDYICPKSPNIRPDYDYYLNGSAFYTVCKGKINQSDVLIHGKTVQSSSICLFPAEWFSEDQVFTKPDLTTQAPLSQCYEAEKQGIYARFEGISFNAFYIVEKPNREAMQDCLFGGRIALCPSFSFGKFR